MKKTKKKELKKDNLWDKSLELVEWDDLAYELMNLEMELYYLKDEMKPKEIKVYELLIESCEVEKAKRMKEMCEKDFLSECAYSAIDGISD